ncbi:MAG: phosphoribosylamine--glycine ligase [Eubacteriales bacterium]
MTVLVIGSGGREHAILQKIAESPLADKIYALPGNGAMASIAECHPTRATDIDGIVSFAKSHRIDFAVVCPDDPLVLGCVDRLEELGIPAFGPTAAAAAIEGSKVFSKNLMKKYGIPTASGEVFDDPSAALEYLKGSDYPTVIKAEGLALGKGVIIAESYAVAAAAIDDIMCKKVFGASGNRVLIEEFLTGPEVSVLAMTDGETLVPMVSSMDHKRAGDNDTGPNTGGMGTIAPNPYYTEEIARECMETIFLPTIRAMKAEGRTFKGCLYFGLMLTPKGPKVIEYNCRFGDPETQVVLPLLEGGLLKIMMAVRDGKLKDAQMSVKSGAACCVVMASKGYPGKYETGYEITLPECGENERIYIAGARLENGKLFTSGGRVLGAVATAPTHEEAVRKAYALSDRIHFANAYRRSDIGQRALRALQKQKD